MKRKQIIKLGKLKNQGSLKMSNIITHMFKSFVYSVITYCNLYLYLCLMINKNILQEILIEAVIAINNHNN